MQVLSGCVESVEDHGCIVDIGVSGTKAFLPEEATKTKQNQPRGVCLCVHVDAFMHVCPCA